LELEVQQLAQAQLVLEELEVQQLAQAQLVLEEEVVVVEVILSRVALVPQDLAKLLEVLVALFPPLEVLQLSLVAPPSLVVLFSPLWASPLL